MTIQNILFIKYIECRFGFKFEKDKNYFDLFSLLKVEFILFQEFILFEVISYNL